MMEKWREKGVQACIDYIDYSADRITVHYQPGNGTRYLVVITRLPYDAVEYTGGHDALCTIVNFGVTMGFYWDKLPDMRYMEEKMNLSYGDSEPLEALFRELFQIKGYPQ